MRQSLYPGSFAKLIFRIAVDSEATPEAHERMWVIVREVVVDGYLGMLDNEPTTIAANDSLWVGTELPFEALHVIDVQHASEDSIASLAAAPPIPWPLG